MSRPCRLLEALWALVEGLCVLVVGLTALQGPGEDDQRRAWQMVRGGARTARYGALSLVQMAGEIRSVRRKRLGPS